MLQYKNSLSFQEKEQVINLIKYELPCALASTGEKTKGRNLNYPVL